MMNKKVLAVLVLTSLVAACGGGEKRKAKQVEEKKMDNGYVCRAVTDDQVAAQFNLWNDALKTGNPKNVVARYGDDSILLPTVSDKVRYSAAEKEDYFKHFLEKSPVGEINERHIQIGCNFALDAGVYTFHYQKTGEKATGRYSFTYRWDGKQWVISSHHSSLMPEALLKAAAKPAPQQPAQVSAPPAQPMPSELQQQPPAPPAAPSVPAEHAAH